MQTNLMDKEVFLNDNKGKICAVYSDRAELYVAVMLDDGSIRTCLARSVYSINTDPIKWFIVIKWTSADKVKAIKTD